MNSSSVGSVSTTSPPCGVFEVCKIQEMFLTGNASKIVTSMLLISLAYFII